MKSFVSRSLSGCGIDPAGCFPADGQRAGRGGDDLSFSANGTGGAAAGRNVLNLRIIASDLFLPRVTSQPTGATAPSLQWTRDRVAVPGAPDPVLSLAAAQPADAGTYVLVATNPAGGVSTVTVRDARGASASRFLRRRVGRPW